MNEDIIADQLNATIKKSLEYNSDFDTNNVSDGYHTFWELYNHRVILWIKLCEMIARSHTNENFPNPVWMSKLHSDWSSYEWWFVLWIFQDNKSQITYHIPMQYWDEVWPFAVELEKWPELDWHTSNDVLERLKKL